MGRRSRGSFAGFPIRWSLGEPELPVYDDLEGRIDRMDLSDAREEDDFEWDHGAHKARRTKLSGYASFIQAAVDGFGDFAFQIASEEKPGFMVGDNGNLYFFVKNGQFTVWWDCY